MNSIVTQRFMECANELLGCSDVRSMRQFAKTLSYLPTGISEMKNGRRDVTIELVRKAIELHGFNPIFLFEGSGSPLKRNQKQDLNILSIAVDADDNERIIHVPIPAQAGYVDQFHDPEFIKELPTYTLPDYTFKTGTYRSFDIDGSSMQPTLYKHDKVICSYIESVYWPDAIKDNQLYVVITQNDIVVKRLINNIRQSQSIQCLSDNKEFESYDIDLKNVQELWKVSLRMTTRFESPTNIYKNLQDQIDRQNAMIETLCDTLTSKKNVNNPLYNEQ